MSNNKAWRPSIFAPKDGDRVQGVLTKRGAECFERVRQAIAKKHGIKSVSDGDAIEYMARWACRTKR